MPNTLNMPIGAAENVSHIIHTGDFVLRTYHWVRGERFAVEEASLMRLLTARRAFARHKGWDYSQLDRLAAQHDEETQV